MTRLGFEMAKLAKLGSKMANLGSKNGVLGKSLHSMTKLPEAWPA